MKYGLALMALAKSYKTKVVDASSRDDPQTAGWKTQSLICPKGCSWVGHPSYFLDSSQKNAIFARRTSRREGNDKLPIRGAKGR